MLFSSLLFLFSFLPVVLALYWLTPTRWRNWTALVASLWFYAWGAPAFVFVLCGSALADYLISLKLAAERANGSPRRWLALGVLINLSMLIWFKYANFLVMELGRCLSRFGIEVGAWTEVALPIGISFFTFQKLSYLVDVYRGTCEPAPRFRDYLLYVAMFPQLIAGPIVRYHDIATQLTGRRHSPFLAVSGIGRFCLGLARKVLIANPLGQFADQAFLLDQGAPVPGFAWLGLLCYTLQIYYDFAGYSDMAIGLGRMFGFRYLENFNAPYISANFTEFWRRWHISLSNWMREYLYIPLGGNRHGRLRTIVNLWFVFLLSGLWHGAAWNFLLWGAYHGFFLSLDRIRCWRGRQALPFLFGVPTTFFLVMVGWVLFRAESLHHALIYYQALVGMADGLPLRPVTPMVDGYFLFVLTVAVVFAFLPLLPISGVWRYLDGQNSESAAGILCRFVAAIALLVLSSCSLASGGFNPFIYFRF